MKAKGLLLSLTIVSGIFSCSKDESPTLPPGNPNLPEKPTLFLPQTSPTGNYIIRWTKSVRSLSFTLQETEDQYFQNPTNAYSGTDTTVRIANKPLEREYFYRIRGNNNEGNGEWCNIASIRTHLLPAPDLRVLIDRLDYGDVLIGQPKVLGIPVKNDGSTVLVVTAVTPDRNEVSLVGSLPVMLDTAQTDTLQLRFSGFAEGTVQGTITIESTDPDDYPSRIPFSAVARRTAGKGDRLPLKGPTHPIRQGSKFD